MLDRPDAASDNAGARRRLSGHSGGQADSDKAAAYAKAAAARRSEKRKGGTAEDREFHSQN